MTKDTLFDDLVRMLASPMPRRRALRTIVRGLAGAAVISLFGTEIARADPRPSPEGDPDGDCPENHYNCHGFVCCNNNTQTCCGSGASSACYRPPETCVGGQCKSKASPSVPR